MAKNKTLEAARKAYNKSAATKYRNTGNKKTKKKEQKVKSHYGGVAKKAQDTEENRAAARAKTGSVAKSVGSNVVRKKTTNTSVSTGDNKKNGSRSGAITPVSSKQKERQVGASTARTTAKGVGKTVKKATNLHKANAEVTDVTQGTARGTAAGTAFNKGKAAEKALEKAGEKKTLTVKKDQLTAEQKAAQERAARQTRFYTNSLVASGRITQKEADEAVEKAKKNASKGVKEEHTLTYSNSAQSNEKVQRVANASKFTNAEVEDEKAKEKAIREARFYTNSQVAAGNMSQKEADKIVKEAGKGHRTTQSANILDKLGGEGEAERQGTRQAGQMNDSKFASGVMQGMSYGDNTRAVGKYNKQAEELVDTVKQSGAFNAGYMTGQGLQFMLGGTNKMTDALVKGVAKSGAMRSALNVGLRKGGADILFESPINALDAVKMSTDANGNFDKKSFVKYLALNTGLSGAMGGAIGGIGAKMTKNDVRIFANLSEKLNKNIDLSPDELKQYDRIKDKLDNALAGNDRVKDDYINAGKADAVLSGADKKDYMSLLGKKETGKLTQQENVRLSSYESVIKQNYDKAQDNYAKILADASGGEKVDIKDVKEATEFFERSGNAVKAQEAETILKNTTKERQLEIIKQTNPKDESLGDHTWVESVDDIKTFDEAINSDEAGFTPDFTKEMADEALEKGEITVYSSKPIEDGAFVTPSKMEAESYAGGGEVFEQTIKTDDVAWLDELQGQVAKVSDEPKTKSFDAVFERDTIDESDMKSYMENAYKEDFVDDKEAIRIAREATEELRRIGDSLAGVGRGDNSRERVVADRFSRRLINDGSVGIRGAKVRGLDELAEVMQVCRDPRFETSRIVYMKGDTIVSIESVTSNMPTFSRATPEGMNFDEYAKAIRSTMNNLGADGYYFVHNHPASFVTPSDKDVMLALGYRDYIDGFKGGLILNHTKYGIIDITGTKIDARSIKRAGDVGDDPLKKASVSHPVLADSLGTDDAIASALKKVEDDELVTTIIYTDSKGMVTGAETISNALAADRVKFREFLKIRTTHYGAKHTYIGTHDSTVVKNAEQHILDGDITNCISFKDNPQNISVGTSKNIERPKDMYFGKDVDEYLKDGGVEEPSKGGSFIRKKSLYNYSTESPKSKGGFDPKKFAEEKNKLQEENNNIIEKIKSTADEDEVIALTKQSDEVEEKIRQMGSEPNRGEKPETPQEQVKLSGKEAQKLVDSKYVSDEVKTALKDIEDAGVYKDDAEKVAKRFNAIDKKIAGLQKRLNNAKNKDYPTEAEKTAHIAELEDELKTLRSQQAKAAGKIEQMGKMKAVDDSIDPQDQFHQLRGDTGKVNEELKNADNLKNEDNWIKDKWNSVRRLWEDSLIEVENVAKRSDDKKLREEILTAANRVRNSQNVANFWITQGRSTFDNKVSGKALDEIFPKELLENEAKYKDFQEYLIMKHVPARHAKGTDIYPEVSPELADKIVKKLEGKYGKELTDWADDVYGYLKDLQQYRVDSGMLSKEAADKFAKDYPFYVPTNRVNEDEAIDFFTDGLSNQIRTAKGGENDVLDMYSQLYTATNKTIHAAEENEMLNLYFRAKGVTPEQIKGAELPDLEHAVIEANVNKKTGSATVSFFVDGKPVKFPCSHQLALGLRELDGLEFERLMNAAKVSTLYGKPFKALITDWNLVFGVRNGMRDMQQAVVNSKDTRYFGSSFGAAGHAIAHEDSPYRKLYASMGGERAQLVSYDAVAKNLGIEKQGKVDALHEKVQDWVDADIKGKHINPVHYIEGINGAIEMMPRMCEFIGTLRKEANSVLKKQGSSLKKLRKEIIDEVNALEKEGKIGQSEIPAEVENRLANRIIEMVDKDTIDSAMRNANDITLNFGRSGVLGKALNMGFVPYLNPSIQGLSKLVRLFTEAKGEGGWKALASIGMKLGTFTIAPAVWNELALRNNEEYQNLNTRDKDNNFFIALGDGKFIKIPKPRENAVLAEPVEYGLRYFLDKSEYAFFDWGKLKTEDVPLWDKIPLTDEGKQSLRTAVDNIGVINPMTSNMVSPLWQTFHNKTWYGGSIESAYETAINEETGKANVPVNKRYDTGTSGVAIWLGQSKVAKELNLSPKKIDNILDSYTGMIYDLGISQTTEEAKTRGNYLLRTAASQFLKDSVFSNKLSTKAWEKIDGMSKKEQDEYKSKYMYDAYKYDDAMDAITADKNMTVKEKMEAKRFLQKQRNKLYRAAINGEENTTNPLKDISKYLGANKTLNKFLPKSGDEQYDNWTDYYKNYKKTKGYKNLTPAQKEKEAQKFLDVYTLGVEGQSKISGDFHDAPSWGMTGVAAAQRYKKGKLSQKDAETIMQSCGVYESQTASYFKYADHGGNVSRYAVTKKNNNKAEDLANELGVSTKGDGSIWKNKYSKEKGIKGGVLSMSLATGKADFKDRAYYISNSGDSNMLIKMNAARGYSEKYGHTTKQLIKLGKKADTDGNTYLSNEEIESACNTIKGGKATSEEKAMAWVLLGGNPNKNPFGAIGNYSHDGDTGITMDDDGKSGGGGRRRGRGRRGRGGGGGGSKKGTMPKTESGAIKGKVTDVFATSNGSKASNLNDAYRKKVRKMRKELR